MAAATGTSRRGFLKAAAAAGLAPVINTAHAQAAGFTPS